MKAVLKTLCGGSQVMEIVGTTPPPILWADPLEPGAGASAGKQIASIVFPKYRECAYTSYEVDTDGLYTYIYEEVT